MKAPKKTAAGANRLLSVMSRHSRELFLADCDRVEFDYADVLCESGERISHVYFPTDSFISLVTALEDGSRLEVGIIGDEGMLGTSLLLGVNSAPQHALVQGAGAALRMSSALFRRHCKDNRVLREGAHRYVHVLLAQLAMTAACARFHVVEARLARWLLLTRDRAHSSQFQLTHEFLAYMLGVRRVGVTEAAGSLQDQQLIRYSRGRIVIDDEAGLEKISCACYRQANRMYERTMGSRRLPARAR